MHTCTLSTPLQFTHVTNAAGSAGGIPASHFSLAGSVVIPTTGSGGATGVPMFAVLAVATGFVPESACLFGAAAAGTVLPQVRLASYSPLNSVTPATEIELSSASVVKFTLATLPGGWVSVSSEFNYDAIELTATEINSDGIAGPSSTASYDLVSGTP